MKMEFESKLNDDTVVVRQHSSEDHGQLIILEIHPDGEDEYRAVEMYYREASALAAFIQHFTGNQLPFELTDQPNF